MPETVRTWRVVGLAIGLFAAVANFDELSRWLGKESGLKQPAHPPLPKRGAADLPPALSLFIELQGTVLIVAMNLTFVTITEPIV